MASGNNKSNKQNKINELNSLIAKRKRIFNVAVSIIIAVVLITGVLIVSGVIKTSIFNSSTSVKTGSFQKISSSDLSSNGVNIYFLSWQGCPIGASDSWVLYDYFHTEDPSLSNSTIYKEMHFSDPSESPTNIPGLLFNNFSYPLRGMSYHFHVIYVYGENLPPDGTASVNQGITVLKASFSSTISSYFVKYQTVYPTSGLNGKPIATYAGHLTSSIIITGPSGSYYLEGEIYNPSTISGIQPSTLIHELSSYSGIPTGESLVSSTVSSVI
jgi:hypothetical protein